MNCVKLQDTKPTYKNQLFLYSKNELSTKEIKKKILLIIAQILNITMPYILVIQKIMES